jgi:D-glycero-D-manno-heptose 1,7-bisphosphate phosphatase
MTPRLALLDRDGTINVGAAPGEYIETPDELVLLRGAGEAVARLNRAGVAVAVVTNQRGVALGRMTLADLEAVHAKLERELSLHGAWIDAVYACPHAHDECTCRKPQPGMLLDALRDFGVSPTDAVMIGDSPSDAEAGHRAGTATIRLGAGGEATDLAAAVDRLVS